MTSYGSVHHRYAKKCLISASIKTKSIYVLEKPPNLSPRSAARNLKKKKKKQSIIKIQFTGGGGGALLTHRDRRIHTLLRSHEYMPNCSVL